jgi:hypothetical protein
MPKLQFGDAEAAIGIWSLGILWSLVTGTWDFVRLLTTDYLHERPPLGLSPVAEDSRPGEVASGE